MTEIQSQLFSMQDLEYKAFHSRLMPTIEPDTIIGVRIPMLRAYAKRLVKEGQSASFLQKLPHQYYEENNLHGYMIEQTKDFSTCVAQVEAFLPYVDNWATCDTMAPKVFAKHKPELLSYIKSWLNSREPYTVRFAVNMLMRFYLDEDFDVQYLDWVAGIRSEEYYVKMVVAWYFATALAKQYKSSISYIEKQVLDKWTHNKTIQKARESYRITEEQKDYLKTLKVK